MLPDLNYYDVLSVRRNTLNLTRLEYEVFYKPIIVLLFYLFKYQMNTNELWEDLGNLEEEDVSHVLTRLFTIYEERLSQKPDDEATALFFKHLGQALDQVGDCNLNRR